MRIPLGQERILDALTIDNSLEYAIIGNSSGGHIAMMSVLFNAHKLCNLLPKIAGIICESASTDILICSKAHLPPWIRRK